MLISSSVLLVFNLLRINCQTEEIWNSTIHRNNSKSVSDIVQTQEDMISNIIDASTLQIHLPKTNGNYTINDTLSGHLSKTNNVGTDKRNNFNTKKYLDYNPDANLDTLQLIAKNDYPAESHTVKTEDGYLLTMHRIPYSKNSTDMTNRQPVFLQHGLLGSSSNFVTSGAEKGLAFILAEMGYDVWMGNFRGNTYSRAHITLSIKDSAFWKFTWHEMGIYDLPAMIDYVNKYKNTTKKILYVGHSMGTTTLFALLSTRTEYNDKLKAAFTLAPVAYMTSIRSPIRLLSPFANDIEWIAEYLGANDFFPQSVIFKWLGNTVCEINHYSKEVCLNIMFLFAGYDEKEFNNEMLDVIVNHTPAGTSTRTVIHFAQEIRDHGKFQQFDHGSEANEQIYGQKTPPEYDVSKITLPIALFCADNDWLSGMPDSKKLYRQLKNPIEYFEVPMKDFNHLDFLWAIDAPTLVYNKLLELLSQYRI